jgi:hypothetical protein
VTAGRAGQEVDDLCRACKAVRHHTVIATDPEGEIVRVMCGFCRSEHNYRGGGGVRTAPTRASASPSGTAPEGEMVSERERSFPKMAEGDAGSDLEMMLRRVIREEVGLTPVAPAARWRGGQLVLRPASASVQEKAWPIESFFHKVVMLRNRLRTLEQQVNASALSEDEKVKLQGYVTACYGTLTSFNVLFADPADHFKGSGGD